MFGGSVDDLLMTLVKSRQLDVDKLAQLQQLVEEHTQRNQEEHD